MVHSSFRKPKKIIIKFWLQKCSSVLPLGNDISLFSSPLLQMCKLPHAMTEWLVLTASDTTLFCSSSTCLWEINWILNKRRTRITENLIRAAAPNRIDMVYIGFRIVLKTKWEFFYRQTAATQCIAPRPQLLRGQVSVPPLGFAASSLRFRAGQYVSWRGSALRTATNTRLVGKLHIHCDLVWLVEALFRNPSPQRSLSLS